MVRTVVTELGRLDVMVANAGIADVAPLIDVTPEAFDRLISNATPATCAARSDGVMSKAVRCHAVRSASAPCGTATPFGVPVDPEVCTTYAVASPVRAGTLGCSAAATHGAAMSAAA